MILAGEASGDAHAAAVAQEIRRRWPDAALSGIGGPQMADAGVELLATLEELAVMGFAEVADGSGIFCASRSGWASVFAATASI